jgi:hypothetical protein
LLINDRGRHLNNLRSIFRCRQKSKTEKPEIPRFNIRAGVKTRSGEACFFDFISTRVSIFQRRRKRLFSSTAINAGFFKTKSAELDLQNLEKEEQKNRGTKGKISNNSEWIRGHRNQRGTL